MNNLVLDHVEAYEQVMGNNRMLDTLLGHDAWTTRHLLQRCRELSDTQLDQIFDIGHRTVRETFDHIISNMEVWGDLLAERPVRPGTGGTQTMEQLLTRFDQAADDLQHIVQVLWEAGRLNDTFLDILDNPPRPKRFGTTILHLVTHSMIHRSELLHMMERLGMTDLIEDSPLTWEERYSRRLNHE